MSRSGYSDNCGGWELIRWRGAVASAIKGKRGQAALKEILTALDAMPQKRLVAGEFEQDGEYCTLGLLGHYRGIDMSEFNDDGYTDQEAVANALDLPKAFVCEVMFENDEAYFRGSPEERWQRMRQWVVRHIRQTAKETP